MKATFFDQLLLAHKASTHCASNDKIEAFYSRLIRFLFPVFSDVRFDSLIALQYEEEQLKYNLMGIVPQLHNEAESIKKKVSDFFEVLPETYDRILFDAEALFSGDPAAKNIEEVVRTYPGFYAIAAYRIAHAMDNIQIPIVPRTITELAHTRTGIDIHPGAKIGKSFCIDHGTGVVIGETTIIGDRVKIYQGVTLGALSVNKEDATKKRHPTIEDDVVIYAGATILGGNTTIGKRSTIGGNVWLTKSVPPDSKVYYKALMHHTKDDSTDVFVFTQ